MAAKKKFTLYKDGQPPTLLETEQANMVWRFLNALADAKVSPNGYGKFMIGTDEMILDLTPIQSEIENLIKKLTQNLVDQSTNSITNLTDQVTQLTQLVQNLQSEVNSINNRLDNASIEAECNDDGTITVTLHL